MELVFGAGVGLYFPEKDLFFKKHRARCGEIGRVAEYSIVRGIDRCSAPRKLLCYNEGRSIMLRNSTCHLRLCLLFGLVVFACSLSGCVMGPTNGCVLKDNELVHGFQVSGFMERPGDADGIELEIYDQLEGRWGRTPVMLGANQILLMNRDGGVAGYGARWYYWEMTGYIPNWGWIHVEDDHYTAEIRVVRRDGTPLWTFNDSLGDYFDPHGGSLGELWINAGAGTTITLHTYLDEEEANRIVHPRNR